MDMCNLINTYTNNSRDIRENGEGVARGMLLENERRNDRVEEV